MWLILAFTSAVLLGFYDVSKKQSLKDNAVIPILFLNTVFSSILFLPFILYSLPETSPLSGSVFYVPQAGWEAHRLILLKSVLVLASWICGYFGMKHLPITIVGPINATRPVMVLLGALIFFSERLNLYQWIGVSLSIVSFFLLSRSGKKEGIDFSHNKWIVLTIVASLLGALSGLYDKYLLSRFEPLFVQSWYVLYQVGFMGIVLCTLWLPTHRRTTPFRWTWTIPLISLFLSSADFAYFYALSHQESMISVVSMIRRSSVIVSFLCGALIFREKNLRSKAIDLVLVVIGMIFLYFGSR